MNLIRHALNIDNINVDAAINNAQTLIDQESDLSPALRSALGALLLLVTLLLNRTTPLKPAKTAWIAAHYPGKSIRI